MAEDQLTRIGKMLMAAEDASKLKTIVETHVKILSAAYDRSIAYTNIIILGGYAFYFALWAHLNGHFTPLQELSSGLLMIFSAVIFVFFEVYKMYVNTAALQGYNAIVQANEGSSDELVKRVQGYELQLQSKHLSFLKIWRVTLALTVGPALMGIGVFIYATIHSLIKAYHEYSP